jgi:PAS domain S-box-containing protein
MNETLEKELRSPDLFANGMRRILLVDDNRAIHEDFRKILCPNLTTATALEKSEEDLFPPEKEKARVLQYEVDSAYQGQEAVAMVEKALESGRPYAMAFVDVRMPPGWDGVETTRKMQEIDPDIQVVICTAYADYSWEDLFEKIGNRDGLLILKKPFDAVEALQLAHALTEKWALHQQSRQKMEDLERRVAERTRELQWKTAFLEAQVSSSIDGILVVSQEGKKALQNQRVVDLFKIPPAIADADDDAAQIRWVAGTLKHPEQFVEQIVHLSSHPDEISRDEIELKDGTVMDRYSSPVIGNDGIHYGRIWTFRDITERKRSENALRESNEKFHQLADNITDAFWIRSPDLSEIHYISPAFEKIWGRSLESLAAEPQKWADFVVPEDRARVAAAFAALREDSPRLDIEYRILRPNGEIRWVRTRGFQVRDATNKLIRHTGIVTDITERKELESRLFQSQKMETVGKLAGGIAHEFNSILTAIIGQSELLLNDLPPDSPLCKNATEIGLAADRAATLTRQLLAYGRKQILQPEILDLNVVLSSMEGTLRHLLGDTTDLQVSPSPGIKMVKADAGQIEQVIMNMTINAHDAMANGGKLMLETANVSFDQESVGRYPELKPGDYVMLAITDTGAGMSDEVKARAFEPFFTTKEVGQGTGLGLSTCYGIIKQSGGHISLYSEQGRGATFKIYLPQVEARPKSMPRLESLQLPRGTETILLVEDDPALREMAATLLKRLGYTVLEAGNGLEALRLKQQRDIGHIDLLFTDVVMPHMSGKELADRVRASNPNTKVLFASAYTENAIVHQGVLEKGVALLQKPFTPSAMAHKLRKVLDEPAA